MNHRERFFATIARQPVDRPACWLGLPVPSALPNLFEYFKVNSVDELKEKIDDDIYPICVPYNNPPTNDIGCSLAFAKSGVGGAQDERTLTAPGFFEDMTDPALVDTFPWPDPKDHIDAAIARQMAMDAPADKIRMGIMWACHFQDACSAFGMENALMTMVSHPEMFKAVIDRITEFYLDCGKIFYEATKGYLDAVLIGNDFGSQRGLMISREDLQKYVFPGTKRLVEQAQEYGLKVVHHSCGSIYPVINDLFNLGVDIIHPIQAKAKDMGVEKLSADFKNGSFFGGIDAQHLLVNGTPEDVRAEVNRARKEFPTGLILSPSHEAVLPDIKPENIEALFKAAHEDEKHVEKKRYGQVIALEPETAVEYKQLHQSVWPKVLEMIKECHINNYSIFFKDNYLFTYFEYTGTNYEADMAKMAADPVTQKWWSVVMPLQKPIETRGEGEWWADMDEVFHFEWEEKKPH